MQKQFVIVGVGIIPKDEMFIASTAGGVCTTIDRALKFTYGEDNPDIKVAAYNRLTGLGPDSGCGQWLARPI